MNDENTDLIVLIGEIGGQLEIDAAKWVQKMEIKNQLLDSLLVKLLQR